MSKTILILGAGFGGLRVAQELEHQIRELGGREIVVVDRCKFHTYTPLLYEVATGFFPTPRADDDARLAQGAQVPMNELQDFIIGKKISFLQGEVAHINTKDQRVELKDGTTLGFETLVLALGSGTDDYGIPGVLEFGMPYKTVAHALALRKKFIEFIARKKRGQEVQISVVIGGGGATGVELAAELAKFFSHMVLRGDIKSGDYTLTLVEIGPRLLASCSKTVSDWAYERLTSLGVKVLRDSCIKRVDGTKIVLAPRPLGSGETVLSLLCDFRTEHEHLIEADILVWAGGITSQKVFSENSLLLDAKGRVVVDEFGRAKGLRNVWAVGDCAAWQDPKTGQGVPALAQAAIHEAHVVSQNILKIVHGFAPSPYPARTFPLVLPMGGKYAVFEQGELRGRGFFPWIIRELADLRYFLSVFAPLQGIRIFIAGARVYQKND